MSREGSYPPYSITPAMDRHNGSIFFIAYVLIFLAAPVIYVGVVQAALCDKLGASATIANLPSAAFFGGNFVPVFLTAFITHRHERSVIVWASTTSAALLAIVCLSLLVPLPDFVRIGALILQGLVQGFCSSTSQVFMFQCMGRGTTVEGRAKAFKLAYGFGPIAAVIGSLGAQFILNKGIPTVRYPHDFALLYFLAIPCMVGVALVCRRFELISLPEAAQGHSFHTTLMSGFRAFVQVRSLLYLWISYALWYSTLSVIPNLSLYAKQALGREPKELSGWILALRFGFKCLAGYLLGVMTLRYGIRLPLIVTVGLLGGAILWAWTVPGHAYLLSFGLMGAGELGGAYFPNYLVAVSPVETGARNQALLTLATPVAGLAATLHGALTDHYGFSASFGFGLSTALLALCLLWRLPTIPVKRVGGAPS